MRKRSLAAAFLGALALVGSLLVATPPAQALNDTGTGGVFVPATGRILDTQAGTGGYSTPMPAGTYRTIKVAGLFGLPDDGSVGAVSLNATVAASSGAGTLFGRPDADSGATTMLIYSGVKGEFTSNTATIAVGADGTIQVMANTNARLILDVQGYYTANTDGTASGGLVPVAKRIVDTRSGLGAAKATIAPGKSIDVQITGANGIPAGASGVVVNLIAINTTDSDGYLTPYATGDTKPQNALHYAPSISTSAQAQVPLSSGGKITIANGSATANLVIDLQGYFTAAGTDGAVFTPSYGRAYDSRASGNTALANGETRSIQIAGKAGVPVMGSGITAVTLTLIVSHAGSAGYAEAWADGTSKPGTTAINFQTDDIRTNTITVPLGANGKVALRNVADATNYVVDVQGWYANTLTPKIACAYPNGSWTAALPDEDPACTVYYPPVTSSQAALGLTVDGKASEVPTPSASTQTLGAAWLDNTAGVHSITASLNGAAVTYSFGLGDWSHATLAHAVTGKANSNSPSRLSVWSSADQIPDRAEYTFHIADASGAEIATSATIVAQDGDHSADWAIPASIDTTSAPYTWWADIDAVSAVVPASPGSAADTRKHAQTERLALAVGSSGDGANDTTPMDPSDVDPSDTDYGTNPPIGSSPAGDFPAIYVPCFFDQKTDTPHISKDKILGPTVSVHGWWENKTCDATTARVSTTLQMRKNGKWTRASQTDTRTVKSGGGSGRWSNGRHICEGTTKHDFRGTVSVDLVGFKDTPNVTVGAVKDWNCS